MPDVVTFIGANDAEFSTVVKGMVSKLQRAKTEIEALHISPGKGMKDPLADNPFYAATKLAGYGNPLYSKVFASQANVQRMLGISNTQTASTQNGFFESMAAAGSGLKYGAGIASTAVGAALVINKMLESLAEMSRRQAEWRKEVVATADAYVRVQASMGKPSAVGPEKRNAIEEMQQVMKEVNDSGKKRMDEVAGTGVNSGGVKHALVLIENLLASTPGISKWYDFGPDGKKTWEERQADIEWTTREQSNRIARVGHEAIRQAELRDAREKFITNGQILNQQAEEAQRVAQARQKEISDKERIKRLATEDLKIEELQQDAVLKRLSGQEKDAQLLEARAEYLRKNLEIERTIGLTTEQMSEAQQKAFAIYQGQTGAIERAFQVRGGRISGVDLSRGGADVSAAMRSMHEERMIRRADDAVNLLKAIAKNTAGPREAVFG